MQMFLDYFSMFDNQADAHGYVWNHVAFRVANNMLWKHSFNKDGIIIEPQQSQRPT